MTKLTINIGTADKGDGDPLRVAFNKVNENFTEIYGLLGLDDNSLNLGAFEFDGSTMTTTDSTAITIAQEVTVTGSLTVGGDVVPTGNLQTNLGSPIHKFHSIYVGAGSVYIGDAKLSLESGRLSSSVGFDLTDSIGVVNGTVDWTDVTSKPAILTNLENTDTLTFADGLNISNSVISRRLEQLGEGTLDAIGSKLTLTNNSIAMEAYADPDGLNNIAYGRVTAGGGQVVLKGAIEDVGGETSTIATIGGGFTVVSTDGVVTSVFGVDMGGLVLLSNNHYIEPLANDLKIASNGDAIICSNSTDLETTRSWTFDKSGTVTTPLLLPKTFTAVLDNAHRTVGNAIVGDPWQYTVSFVVGLGGVVETQIDNPDWPTNPGYASGDEFEFTEADHGIPGFAFAVTLNAVSEVPETGFVVMLGVTPPPEYPSTVSSLGAIKLSANTSNWVFDPNGTLHYPDGSFGSTAFIGIAETISNTSNVTITSNSNTTPQTWTFTDTGELQLPSAGSIRQNNSWTRTVAPTVSVGPGSVVWSSNVDYISSAKLVIQVEGNEIDDVSGWHSQACEAIIACRGYANTYGGPGGDPQMIVYGIVHTSINPLVTFTVQRNPTTKFVEVVGTLTAAASGNASLRIHSVEMSTRD